MKPLNKLLDEIEKASKNDSWDYTSGHLNHSHLFKFRDLEKKHFWKSGQKTSTVLHSRLKETTASNESDQKFSEMKNAITKCNINTHLGHNNLKTKGIIGLAPVIKQTSPATPINTPFASSVLETQSCVTCVESPEQEDLKEPLPSEELEAADLKLLTNIDAPYQSFHDYKDKYTLLPTSFSGLTKSDQFRMFLLFEKEVLQRRDITKDFCRSARAEYYENQLTEELLTIAHIMPPHFARLHIFSNTFENVCSDPSIFQLILKQIKSAHSLVKKLVPYFDHLALYIGTSKRPDVGKGLWRLNTRLLEEQEVQERVEILIKQEMDRTDFYDSSNEWSEDIKDIASLLRKLWANRGQSSYCQYLCLRKQKATIEQSSSPAVFSNAYTLYLDYLLESQSSLKHEVLLSKIAGLKKRPVQTKDIDVVEQKVKMLEQVAWTALQHNDQLRMNLKNLSDIVIKSDVTKDLSKTDSPRLSLKEQFGKEPCMSNEVQTFVSKRSEVLKTVHEVKALEEEIKKNMTHALNTEVSEQHIKDVQSETVKLQSSNNFLQRANKDLDVEIKRLFMKQKMDLAKQEEIKNLVESFIRS
ncbi:uncharacterized protein C6orf118 homolog [Gastrophryne carolinensis]